MLVEPIIGYLFLSIGITRKLVNVCISAPINPLSTAIRLQAIARRAGMGDKGFPMHSFRVGAVAVKAIAGEDIARIIHNVQWKFEADTGKNLG